MASAASPSSRLITADELLAMSDDGNRYELLRGVRVARPFGGTLTGVVASRLASRLDRFVRDEGLGVCGIGDGGFHLASDPDTVRTTSIWFIHRERMPSGSPVDGFWPGGPDLAVDMLTASDGFMYVLRKAQDYLDAGTPLFWAIDPICRAAAVFRPGEMPTLLGEDGVLDGGEVLRGFTLRLRDILR